MKHLEAQLIIIDGLDRCGKSTFVEYLRDKYPDYCPMVLHSTKPPSDLEDPKSYQLNHYKKQIQQIKEIITDYEIPVIMDRFHLGEFVYGTLYRNGQYYPEELKELEQPLKSIKTSLYVFTDSTDNRLDRDDGNSLTIDPSTMDAEYKLFTEWYSHSTITNKTFIDWSQGQDFSESTFESLAEQLHFVTNCQCTS